MSDEAVSAILAAVGTYVAANAGTIAAAGSAVSAAGGIASTAYQLSQGSAKPPGPPTVGPTAADRAREQAAQQAARMRVGRGATLLTGGSGGTSLMPTGQSLKTTLGS